MEGFRPRDDPGLAGQPVPAGRHVGRRGRQLLALLRARDGRRPLPVRQAGRRGGGRADPAHQPHRPALARLPARRAAGAPLRLPRPRAVRAATRVIGSTRTSCSSIRTRRAISGPVRWNDAVYGYRDRASRRGPLLRRTRQRRRDAEVRGDRPGVHLGGGPAPGDAVEPHRDLRDARQGTHEAPSRRSRPRSGARTSALAHDPVIEHLRSLGVTAVELLPVHQFVDDRVPRRARAARTTGATTRSGSSPRITRTRRARSASRSTSSSRW